MFYGGGKIVEIGNNYYGLNLFEDYIGFIIFPFGLEIISFKGLNEIAIQFTIFSIQFSFSIGLNGSLFRD